MNSNRKLLKNHISSLDTKTLQNVLKERFGFGLDDMEEALSGNQEKAKEIGEFGRQGRFAAKYAPKVAQSILDGIEGTLAINEASASLLQAAGKADTKIVKAGNKTLLANQRYAHDKTETNQEYNASKEYETKRHEYATNYIELRSLYDQYFLTVDEDMRLTQQNYRPEIKQIQEVERHSEQLMDHLLQRGEESRVDLIPAKDYLDSDVTSLGRPLAALKGVISNVKSALGF